MNIRRDEPGWQEAQRAPARPPSRDELNAPSTQIVTDREAYLGQGRHDVGRRISDDQVELFITGDVAGSLQREFVQHTPEFIALHDLGTSASLRLLTSLAGAAGARVQRLSIRRQGHGVALAVLQFVEMPLADGTQLRVYATDVNADNPTRAQVAKGLLAFSKLGVLLVGELPPHALAGQLAPLHEALLRSTWPNRELLLVPLGSSLAMAAHAAQLAQGSAVSVHVTPQADKPRQAWGYIGGAWNRMNGGNGTRTLSTDLAQAVPKPRPPASEAPTQPMELRPIGPAPTMPMPLPTLSASPVPMPKAGGTSWQAYAERCALIKGAVSVCVFDLHNVQTLAHAGGAPAADRLAQQGSTLLAQMNDATRALGLGPAQAEASISTTSHHLLLRPVPGHPGVAVHIVVSATTGNPTLARMQLERIEAPQ
ncbi:MAG: hypothetical protein C0505_20325 [Leptothrix sp. (in: Bacteria)]|nr:hypothetical protein [Leptothrix sp. (in: b-proteobacteria)]